MKGVEGGIRKTTKSKLPRLPFFRIKNFVLGKEYDLSLVFIGRTLSRRLNKKYRGKDKPANVLSFPLSSQSGEIFIDSAQAKKDAPSFNVSHHQFIARLFIHGLFHLKGFAHGSRMEKGEEKVQKRFHL